MQDTGIVRNRMKIEGAVASARAWLDVMEKGPGFSGAAMGIYRRRPESEPFPFRQTGAGETPISKAMSKELARPRLQIRRADDRLRLHAGDRDGQ
jgi:DNA-3-methyladenine glycosylase I